MWRTKYVLAASSVELTGLLLNALTTWTLFAVLYILTGLSLRLVVMWEEPLPLSVRK